MPVTRSPPGTLVIGPLDNPGNDAQNISSQGAIAAAIGALPLDVGTVVSPTLMRCSPGQNSTVCLGGPGNDTCGLEVKKDHQGIECDICGMWYHIVCQKMSKTAYNALSKHYAILAFICDRCRKRPNLSRIQPKQAVRDASVQTTRAPNGPGSCGAPKPKSSSTAQTDEVHPVTPTRTRNDSETLSQLASSMCQIETSIKEHNKLLAESKKILDTLTVGQSGSRPTYADVTKSQTQQAKSDTTHYNTRAQQVLSGFGHNQSYDSSNYRHIVRAELQEMEERKKRVSSLVVRGLRVSSAGEAAAKFSDIIFALTGERTQWTEVCRIRSDADLFRGNIHDSRVRKLILDEAKNLRDSEHSHVFIRRDLTYQQREELRARNPPRFQRQYQWSRQGPGPALQGEHSQSRTQDHTPTLTPDPRSGSPDRYQETVPKQAPTPIITTVPASAENNSNPGAQNSSPNGTTVPRGDQDTSENISSSSTQHNGGN